MAEGTAGKIGRTAAFPGAKGIALLLLALGATIAFPPRPILLWNPSRSSPVGLYLILPPAHIAAGDHVAAWAPDWARRLGAERHYVPLNVPLVKRVAAGPGERVCTAGALIMVRGERQGRRLSFDAAGRPMPWWEGCHRLGDGDYFLFDPARADGFDGRYFGVTTRRNLLGKAVLLWAG